MKMPKRPPNDPQGYVEKGRKSTAKLNMRVISKDAHEDCNDEGKPEQVKADATTFFLTGIHTTF